MRDHDDFLQQALLEAALLDDEQLDAARQAARDRKLDFVDALTSLELIDGRTLAMVRADLSEVPYVDLNDIEPTFDNTKILPHTYADRYRAFPLYMLDGVLTLAMDDPLNLEATDQARQIARCEVDAVQCEREPLRALIGRAYRLSGQDDADVAAVAVTSDAPDRDEGDDQPIIAAVNQFLGDAIDQDASDVHINPDETDLHLRYRIDGVLQEKQGPPLSMHAAIVQRLKVMARLDLTQTKRPQDGKFRITRHGMAIDVRMSSIPTVCGENVVLRLLRNTQSIHNFDELGIAPSVAGEIESCLQQPYGILLVTGPTGSGKTTTLYTALSSVNNPELNIMTIENPVEIRMRYVRQIQTHEEIGLTFASALRSILRQDPDVVLVGEIRDEETARIALQASLTGHLVLSTLHTNDAAGAINRLLDFDIQPFVINSALLGVLAQRLVRRVCEPCKIPDPPTDLLRQRFNLEPHATGFVRGEGCARCHHSGFRGRVGIYEFLRMTGPVRRAIDECATVDQLRDIAATEGMRLMWQDGLDKARLGHTTLSEIARAAAVINVAEIHEEPRRLSA